MSVRGTRAWLRHRSSTWQHFDSSPRLGFVCACGHRESEKDHRATQDVFVAMERHTIGFVGIAGVRHEKFCNGEEE